MKNVSQLRFKRNILSAFLLPCSKVNKRNGNCSHYKQQKKTHAHSTKIKEEMKIK